MQLVFVARLFGSRKTGRRALYSDKRLAALHFVKAPPLLVVWILQIQAGTGEGAGRA